MQFVGFSHYTHILTDISFWWSLLLSILYGIFTIPTGIALSLGLALLLQGQFRFRNLFRTLYFLPHFLDALAVTLIWVLLFSPKYGLIDQSLTALGVSILPEAGLLANPWSCLPTIALVMVLKNCGFGMILFLAALQSIPPSLYEAAEMDGANSWQRFRYITLPLLKPTIFLLVLLGTIGALTAFSEIYAMTANTGGPALELGGQTLRSADLVGYHLYQAFAQGNYGKAAAMSLILCGFAIGFLWLQRRMWQE